ncbi:hypothetical protein Tco_0769984 [Tanacetum coccineum]|uniref:C3H1-type domain-containing protein n=1 Tax=Tanacetum coccineum TaxID=301880 RepID=A0ABQ4ZEI9_9ASTR
MDQRFENFYALRSTERYEFEGEIFPVADFRLSTSHLAAKRQAFAHQETKPNRLCARARMVDECSRNEPCKELHPMGVLKAVRKAQSASSNLSDQEAWFSPTILSKILFKPPLETSTYPLVCG